MSEQEMKKILQELDHQPLPSKEKVLAACEESFEKKEQTKAATVISRRIFTKHGMLRVGALAACLCLLVTGIFGGVGLLKNQFGDATAPMTQHAPDLPLDHYPNGEVDYANMSMVEYMELHPDFLSYRYMPWYEGYAFAQLEILDVEEGYRYQYSEENYYNRTVVKCRVISDAWNVLDEGSELNLFIPGKDAFFKTVSSVLLRFKVEEFYPCVNKSGETVTGMLFEQSLEWLGCFPLEDGKVNLEIMEEYLKKNDLKLNYEGNSLISYDPDYVYCTFDDVASIVADEMNVETALENLRPIYEKYQTGEYNYLSVDLVSTMTYAEYCRVIDGTWTEEDRKHFGPTFAVEYAHLPPLFSIELSLSDGTTFDFCTRMELSESLIERLMKEIVAYAEAICTDENGVLDAEKCIETIKWSEVEYSLLAFMYRSPRL